MTAFRQSAPASNLGYFRASDWPTSQGAGPMPSNGYTVSPGQNGGGVMSQWHPTVAWMLGFVVVELIAFHVLSRMLNL